MRKIIGFIFAFVALVFMFSACKDGETYADKLNKEKKAIERFIKDRDIDLLDEMPSAGYEFKDNEFYKDKKTGVYLRVISSGNLDKMASEEDGSTVYFRYYNASFFNSSNTTAYTNDGNYGEAPLYFTYGNSNSYLDYYGTQGDSGYRFISPACAFPLKYVGEGAEVSMIVPFLNISGSAYQQSVFEPVFYERIKYTSIQ